MLAPIRDAARGVVALGVRQLLVQSANAGGMMALAALLSPADFGVVAVVALLVGIAGSISSLGVDASLVRAPDEPTEDERRAAAALALSVAAALSLAALAATSLLGGGANAAALVACGGAALVLGALQVVPRALCERRLAFAEVARADVAQAGAYNVLAVALAWQGWGVASLGPALVARAAVGAVVLQLAPSRRVWPGRQLGGLGPHLRFGLPMLGTGIVSQAKDAALPVLVGAAGGAAAVGLVTWAQLVAAAPSLALMILGRVYVPMFARLQAAPGALAGAAATALRASHTVVAPIAALMLVLVEPATRLVFGPDWLPALPTFRLLWIANLFAPTCTVLLALLAARGRADAALAATVAWAAGTWLLGAPLVARWGTIGYGVANVAVQVVTVGLVRTVRRDVEIRPLSAALTPWLAAGGAALVVLQLEIALPARDPIHLAALGAYGLMLYGAVMLGLAPRDRLRIAALPERG